ncbi:hypothetical protein JRO89_XS05G0265400 [Xanthoceras sorbifolium]|uniref:Leucine-rich repeat-containing N-terminal plant-type domain-containing protein n=1 Tax=Xanthoceras sorbifolium TaxID=99658 RepID=A0ABQ8I3F8_9ROSI|nr:hypothetical protein JRO89_XS05G0265400 [Xanthoceras sorbifolium]
MGWLSTWSYQLILCIQLLFLHSLTHSKQCSHDQASALIHFKQLFTYSNDSTYDWCRAINPPDQKLKNWKEDTDCCSWGGVTCDMDTGHVTGLNLTCEGLNGTIPSNTTLFLLPYLQVLRLSGNPHVIGAFPEFNSSNPLEVLDVSFTGFSGPLPNSIGNLKSMTELNLRRCNFIGSIPASLGNLTKLTDLTISSNNFNSCIPPSLSNLQSVSTLDLMDNHFVGTIPEIFVNLTQLSSLDLSFNQLSGPIPSSLSGLSNLYYLDLSSNNLSGNLETYLFAKLTNLEQLDLTSNNFSGNLEPYIFPNLTKLSWLALANNSLSLSSTTKVNSSFEAPCNLRELYLSHNKIQGKIPKWMGNLGKDNSISLDLSHNFLTGGIEQLPWKNLEDLDLSAVMACDGAVASSNSRRGQAGVQ